MATETELWDDRKKAIERKLMEMFAASPRDLIVQGKRYVVTMRSYEDGARYDTDGVVGAISVEGDDEHFDLSLHMDGWGAVRSMSDEESEEDE